MSDFRFVSTSSGIVNQPNIDVFIGGRVSCYAHWFKQKNVLTILGWGRKLSGQKAVKIGRKKNLEPMLLEDGFIGYAGHPCGVHTRLSLVKDKAGIYYDATQPSDLETILNNIQLSDTEKHRAETLISSCINHHITKYNTKLYDFPTTNSDALKSDFILVADQTVGDESIEYGCANTESFQRMLNAAISENPDKQIVIKTHPDVIAKKKKGYFLDTSHPNVQLVGSEIPTTVLMSKAASIYVVTSQLGFEALIRRKRVVCFGMPFYAGWGLTDDRLEKPDRRVNRLSLTDLVYGSLIVYPTYVHPERIELCEVEDVIGWLVRRRDYPERYYALGFSMWKRAFIHKFVHRDKTSVSYISSFEPKHHFTGTVLCWGASKANHIREKLRDFNGSSVNDRGIETGKIGLLTMEDGFIRSSGLGSDLKRPSSLVIDDLGVYYDATRPSRLENILNSIHLTTRQIERTDRLIESLVSANVTKYNVGTDLSYISLQAISLAKSKSVDIILVVGQVASDASLKYGSPLVNTNAGLIKRARQDFPNSYLIYKPHPDCVAGNKGDRDELELARDLCDNIVLDSCIYHLYKVVDRIVTMTSLSGFEGLVRGIPVHVYGMPFYAGWGLTQDILQEARRHRSLSLQELVYGALIEYPTYFDWSSNRTTNVEDIVQQISGTSAYIGLSKWHRLIRKAQYFIESCR